MYIRTPRRRFFGDSIETFFAPGAGLSPVALPTLQPPTSWAPSVIPSPAPSPEPTMTMPTAPALAVPVTAPIAGGASIATIPASALAAVQATVQAAAASPSLQAAVTQAQQAPSFLRAPVAPESTAREDVALRQEVKRQQTARKQALQQEAAQTGQGSSVTQPSALELAISPWLATAVRSADVKVEAPAQVPVSQPTGKTASVLLLGGLVLVGLALLR